MNFRLRTWKQIFTDYCLYDITARQAWKQIFTDNCLYVIKHNGLGIKASLKPPPVTLTSLLPPSIAPTNTFDAILFLTKGSAEISRELILALQEKTMDAAEVLIWLQNRGITHLQE